MYDVQNVFRFFTCSRQEKSDPNTFSSSFLPLTLVLSPFKQYLTHTTEDGGLILLPSVRLC